MHYMLSQVNSRGAIALIWGASPQVRSDRRKDRVEVKPEQLAAASAQAEISIILLYNCYFFFQYLSPIERDFRICLFNLTR